MCRKLIEPVQISSATWHLKEKLSFLSGHSKILTRKKRPREMLANQSHEVWMRRETEKWLFGMFWEAVDSIPILGS